MVANSGNWQCHFIKDGLVSAKPRYLGDEDSKRVSNGFCRHFAPVATPSRKLVLFGAAEPLQRLYASSQPYALQRGMTESGSTSPLPRHVRHLPTRPEAFHYDKRDNPNTYTASAKPTLH